MQSDPSGSAASPLPLRAAAYRGAVASFVQQAVRIGLQFASVVVLARLLTPDDFGVFAMVAPLVAFAMLFQEMGLQSAIVQRKHVTPEQLNQLYWLNLTLALGVALLMVAISPLLATYYNDDRILLLTIASALPIFVGGLASQQYAILARSLRFVTLATLDIISAATAFIVAVAAAVLLESYWALWAASAASSTVWAVSSFMASGWRPSKPALRGDSGGMLTFGLHITGVQLLGFLTTNVDNLLIGRQWGAHALGLYDRAYKLLLFPLRNVNGPATRIAVPIMSKIKDDPARLRRGYLVIVRLVTLIAIPGMAAAIAAPGEVIALLLGSQWSGVAPIFLWLGFAGLVQPMVNSISWLMTAQGRTSELLRFNLVAGAVTIGAFLIGLPDGPLGVARAYALSEICFRAPFMIWVVRRQSLLTALDFIETIAPLLLAGLAPLAAAVALRAAGAPTIVLLGLVAVCAYIAAALCLGLLPSGRATLREAMSFAKRSIGVLRGREAEG